MKIPSCNECNQGHSLDEQYIIAALSQRLMSGPAARSVWAQSITPALTSDFQGLNRLLERGRTPLAIAAGNKIIDVGVLKVDTLRLERVLAKIVKGLYFNHAGERLPTDHSITFDLEPDDIVLHMSRPFNIVVIDKHVFAYRYVIAEHFSMWWLAFYEAAFFVGVTGSIEALARRLDAGNDALPVVMQ